MDHSLHFTCLLAQIVKSMPDKSTMNNRTSGSLTPTLFSELYENHISQVYRYHLSRTSSIPDAQDLTAQTFLQAYEKLGYKEAVSDVQLNIGVVMKLIGTTRYQ